MNLENVLILSEFFKFKKLFQLILKFKTFCYVWLQVQFNFLVVGTSGLSAVSSVLSTAAAQSVYNTVVKAVEGGAEVKPGDRKHRKVLVVCLWFSCWAF